ncbi:MAG: hypothetical protein AB1601_03570 [Planctomycetota bacterium]
MRRVRQATTWRTFVAVGLLGLAACASASSGRSTPAVTPSGRDPGAAPGTSQPQRHDAGGVARVSGLDARPQRIAELERRMEVAELKLAQAQIEVEHGDLRHRQTIARLEKEFEFAKRRLEIFVEITIPLRIARAELELDRVDADCRAAEDELTHLDTVVTSAPTDDAPREAAVAQARQRVVQAQRERDLQREELRLLREVLLPLEQMERELEAERKKHAILEAHWDNERALLDRRMAVVAAEIELSRLEQELARARAELTPEGLPGEAAQDAEHAP